MYGVEVNFLDEDVRPIEMKETSEKLEPSPKEETRD